MGWVSVTKLLAALGSIQVQSDWKVSASVVKSFVTAFALCPAGAMRRLSNV